MSILQLQQTLVQDEHLQHLKSFIFAGWLSTEDEPHSNLELYWVL